MLGKLNISSLVCVRQVSSVFSRFEVRPKQRRPHRRIARFRTPPYHLRPRCSAARVPALRFATVLTLAFTILPATVARAAELSDQVHSLTIAPADAAFYSASLRQREQLELFLTSKAYARLLEVPIIQLAKMQLGFQWEQSSHPVVAELRKYVRSDQGQQVVALARQLFAEESFVFASNELIPALELFVEMNSISRSAQIEAIKNEDSDEEALALRISERLRERVAELEVPNIVFGFRIQDKTLVADVLNHLDDVARKRLDEHLQALGEKLTRNRIDGNEFLTLKLDGSMIPWNELREENDEVEINDDEFESWNELLSEKSLTVALGSIGDYLILSIGKSTDHLEHFGEGPSLDEHPPLARLAKHADQRIVSLAYVSEALMKAANSPRRSIDDVSNMVEIGIHAAEVGTTERDELIESVHRLGENVVEYLPEPGTLLAVTCLTPRGYEGYQYNFGTQPMLASTEPLAILGHVGANPLLFVASHSHQSLESYDRTIELASEVALHAEKVAEQKASPDDWAAYQEHREEAVELLRRLNRTVREQLFPALADGQQAIVVDTAAPSAQWFDKMPPAKKPLPMLEIGASFRVSDAQKLREGVAELFDIASAAVSLLHEVEPDDVPAVDLPKPQVESSDDASIYSFVLPTEWGVSEQIAPNGGLTESSAAISAMPEFTRRLLVSTPLEVDTAIDLDRAAAKATHIQFARLVDAIRPWMDYAFDVAIGNVKLESNSDESAKDEPVDPERQARLMQIGFVLPQVHQIMNVLSAVQNYTSITFQEDDVWVTHSELYLKDLE